MNYRVCIVALLGLLAMAVLVVFPPWKAYGHYTGHFRVDRVAFLEFDTVRFYVEEALVALATVAAAVAAWRRKRRPRTSPPTGAGPGGG